MKVKHYLSAVGLLLAGASATAMIAADNQPATRSEGTFDLSFKPADGAVVKQLQVINVCIDMGEDFAPYIDEEKSLFHHPHKNGWRAGSSRVYRGDGL